MTDRYTFFAIFVAKTLVKTFCRTFLSKPRVGITNSSFLHLEEFLSTLKSNVTGTENIQGKATLYHRPLLYTVLSASLQILDLR